MTQALRALTLAAVLTITAGLAQATAQTVILNRATPGAIVELVFNSEAVGTATPGRDGIATVPLKRPAPDSETDVRVSIDLCEGKARRITFVERGLQPAPPEGTCDRRDIPGYYVIRKATTLVVDLGGDAPSVWLRQGPAPAGWLGEGHELVGPSQLAPTGLVVFGAGGLTKFDNAVTVACGTAPDCSGRSFKLSFTGGASYWVTRYVGAEVGFIKPTNVVMTGSGNTYHFDTTLNSQVVTIAGLVGVPLRAVRLYGKVGTAYHEATRTTNETVDARTITVDNTEQTVPGGTQTLTMKTNGWGWLFGGGIEGWVRPSVAIYGEAMRGALKGQVLGGGEGEMNERVTVLLVGVRVRLAGH